MQMSRTKWIQPLFAVALGVLFLAAMWIGGDPRNGLYSLAVMVAFGALILFGGRSETVRGLRGDGRDERFRQIDLAATAIAGLVVITVIIGAFLVEVARGHDGSPYATLGAVAGVAYLVAVAALRLRG
jgi:protein-S-isoprenylcysteine O-methyltransferase Ste14